MVIDSEAIRKYFAKLDLEPQIADLYLALHTFGPQTISELSRNARVERTRIYRLIDQLLASNLIEVDSNFKRGIIKAAPITNLRILINEKAEAVKSLHTELELIEQVLARNSLSSPTTRVQFYHGPEGIRQMYWNLLRSEGEVVSLLRRPIHESTSTPLFKQWVERWNKAKPTMRILLDDDSAKTSKKWHDSYSGNSPQRMEGRLLPPEVMSITFGMSIWNDVVAYFHWQGKDVYGFEIYNQSIADAQRLFFETLWQQARSLKDSATALS